MFFGIVGMAIDVADASAPLSQPELTLPDRRQRAGRRRRGHDYADGTGRGRRDVSRRRRGPRHVARRRRVRPDTVTGHRLIGRLLRTIVR
jgi:hypothetical protein